jgi:flagellar basal-body rod modification protein FlgD
MAQIGRPEQPNSFRNIGMVKKTPSQTKQSLTKEQLLNSIAGKKEKSIFVDGPKKLGKNEFLKLLTTQLQHQDPLKPQDNSKFISELAQFTQLEQMTNMNKNIEKIQPNSAAQAKFYAASFVGKEIVTSGTSINLKENGSDADIYYDLKEDVKRLSIRIFDEKNNMIGHIVKENLYKGNHQESWNGMALDGSPAIKGNYKVQVLAWDENETPIRVDSKVKGLVTGAYFKDGNAILDVNGKKVSLSDVDSFRLAGSTPGMMNGLKNIKNSINKFKEVAQQ